MRRGTALCAFFAACVAVPAARADDAPGTRGERERIAAERAQVAARFAERERACTEHFVVTPCADQAQRERREALDRLRRQQTALDESERRQRAAQRLAEIDAKTIGDDAKRREAEARSRAGERRRAEASATAASAAARPPAHAARPRTASAPSSQARADYDKRQLAAREHREAVERRNAQRAAHAKPARALPQP